MKSFREIISLWPSRGELARDLGVNMINVQLMWRRDSISAENWERLVTCAQRRGLHGVTYELLAHLKAQKAGKYTGPFGNESAVA